MEYRVVHPFHDRAQGGKLMSVGKTYPPKGLDVDAKWLAHLAQYRVDGKPILEAAAEKKKAAGTRKKAAEPAE